MYVLDTDVAVKFMHGDKLAVNTVLSLKGVHTTVATLAELSYGLHRSKNPEKHAKNLLEFIRGVDVVGVGLPTSLKFGEVKAYLMSIGKPIGDFDILIASSCLVHNYHLVTGNRKHFECIPGLKFLDS